MKKLSFSKILSKVKVIITSFMNIMKNSFSNFKSINLLNVFFKKIMKRSLIA